MSQLLKVSDDSPARILTPEEMKDYRAREGISQSMIKYYLKEPSKYWHRYVKDPPDPAPPPTPSMQFGKDLEEFIFENRVPRDAKLIPESALGSGRAKRNLAGQTNWDDWLAANKYDPKKHLLLKKEEWDAHLMPLTQARKQITRHKRARKILFESQNDRKVGIESVDPATGFIKKGELDLFSSLGMIPDVKSSKATNLEAFKKEIWNFGYFIQADYYRTMVFELTGEWYPFVFIVVGNSGDHYCETYEVDQEWYDMARPIIRRGLDRLAEAYEKGQWETRTHGKLCKIKPKRWMTNKVWEDETY